MFIWSRILRALRIHQLLCNRLQVTKQITQNAIQLRRQVKQLSHLEDVTNEDLRTQKKAYTLIVDYLEKRVTDEIEWGGDDDAG